MHQIFVVDFQVLCINWTFSNRFENNLMCLEQCHSHMAEIIMAPVLIQITRNPFMNYSMNTIGYIYITCSIKYSDTGIKCLTEVHKDT